MEETEQDNPLAVEYSFTEDGTGQMTIKLDQNDPSNQNNDDSKEDEPIIQMNQSENDRYELPSVDLLDEPVKYTQQKEKSQIQKTVQILEQTFQSFGVKAKITKAHVGPAVTKYEVYPEAGVKVSKILSLT